MIFLSTHGRSSIEPPRLPGQAPRPTRDIIRRQGEAAVAELNAILNVAEPREAIAYPLDFNAGLSQDHRNTALDCLADAIQAFVDGTFSGI